MALQLPASTENIKKALSFETAHGRARNPKANECVEKSHFFLCQKLAFIMQSTGSKNWASLLSVACTMLNDTVTVTRKTQLTSHEFTFGRGLFGWGIAVDLSVLVDILLDYGELQLDEHSDAEDFLGCVLYKGILSRPPPKDDHDSAEDVPDAVSDDDDELQIPQTKSLRLMPSQSRKHSKDSRKMKTVDLGNGVLLEGFNVPADGDCFFHSVIVLLYGTVNGLPLRKQLMDWWAKNWLNAPQYTRGTKVGASTSQLGLR